VLNPVYSRQLRMFEHARNRGFSSFVLTWWKASRPWSFWRWVRMEHEVVPRRLALFAALAFLTTYAMMVALEALHFWASEVFGGRFNYVYLRPANYWGDFASHVFNPFSRARWSRWPVFPIPPLDFVTLLTFAIVPLSFVLLPRTLRKAKVRRVHVVRVWAYSLAWFPLLFMVNRILGALWEVLRHAIPQSSGAARSFSNMVDDVLTSSEGWFILGATCGWLVLWWSFAARRYLRLPHAAGVGLAMVTLSILLSMLLILIYPGGTWFMLRL